MLSYMSMRIQFRPTMVDGRIHEMIKIEEQHGHWSYGIGLLWLSVLKIDSWLENPHSNSTNQPWVFFVSICQLISKHNAPLLYCMFFVYSSYRELW